jgi:hypothetical protein
MLLAAEGRYAAVDSLIAPWIDAHRKLLGRDNSHFAMLQEILGDARNHLGGGGTAHR